MGSRGRGSAAGALHPQLPVAGADGKGKTQTLAHIVGRENMHGQSADIDILYSVDTRA
uniref:Uncharacterized protein n=1 Tax=Hyaloperonospora arabidopsidis (strain Emoy2) TaxID=559515 RepID=M4BUS8_HYAAE